MLDLAVRQQIALGRDVQLPRDPSRRLGTVARKHPNLDPHASQVGHGACRPGTQLLGEIETRQDVLLAEQEHRARGCWGLAYDLFILETTAFDPSPAAEPQTQGSRSPTPRAATTGDCVRACEWMIERRGDGPVPLLLGFFSGPQKIEESVASMVDDEPIIRRDAQLG